MWGQFVSDRAETEDRRLWQAERHQIKWRTSKELCAMLHSRLVESSRHGTDKATSRD